VTEATASNLDRQICPTCSAIYGSAYDLCPNDGTLLVPGGGDELIGRTLADKYVIDECIGEGGMGRVYKAHHARLMKRTFAIKILLGDLAADPTMRKRFEQEAETASRLQHPNVVSVLDFGNTEGGLLYLVMEFVAGEALSELIKTGPLPEKRVIAITQKLCLGLAHAHSQGLIHRDFKPDNVVLATQDQGDTPRILDFGLAIVRSPEEASIRLTGSGLMVGTPAYISPEQARAASVDQRTDLFSLGITVYEMLAGMLPFSGDAIEVMYSNTKLDAPPISERNPEVEVSVEMQAIVCKLMARNPDERFESARDVLTVLGALAGSDASPDAGESLAMVVASQSTKLRESEVRDQETPTVKNGAAIAADTILAAPAAPTAVARKTKTLTYAVGGVFALALAVFALLKFGGGEAQIAADREQVEPPAEALAGSEPSGTEITKVFEPEPATLSDLEAPATPHDAGSLEVVETPASKDAPNPQSLTKSEIRALIEHRQAHYDDGRGYQGGSGRARSGQDRSSSSFARSTAAEAR
jgi:serine/threonine-protein kinase